MKEETRWGKGEKGEKGRGGRGGIFDHPASAVHHLGSAMLPGVEKKRKEVFSFLDGEGKKRIPSGWRNRRGCLQLR